MGMLPRRHNMDFIRSRWKMPLETHGGEAAHVRRKTYWIGRHIQQKRDHAATHGFLMPGLPLRPLNLCWLRPVC